MTKTVSYAKNFAIAGAIINASINLIKQLDTLSEEPDSAFDWKALLISAGKGALAGAAIGGLAGAICDHNNSLEEPQNTDAFLRNVINRIKLNPKDSTFQKLEHRANQLIEIIGHQFGNKLSTPPMRGGSTTDGTALNSKFDIDIFISFRPSSFRSTRDMYERILSFLESQVHCFGICGIRDQKKSIGVLFKIEGIEYKIDVVPQKLSRSKEKGTSGYLFVNNSTFWADKSTYTKTDFEKLRSQTLTKTQKEIVLVLKHWKNKYDLPFSSHLLKTLVLDAYSYHKAKVPRQLTKKVIMVLEHIIDNLDIAVIRSIENTNNILTNIPSDRKSAIINACKTAIEDYKYQPNSIISTFG